MMNSVWTESSERLHFLPLEGDIRTDVLIIGGGMAGILCAYMLKQAGVDCILAEAKEICGGITKNTTAKITFQHGLLYDKLIRRFGEEKARLYLAAQMQACDEYRHLCREIDCGYEEKDAYVYSMHDRAEIEREAAALQRLGIGAEVCEPRALPFWTAGAVRVPRQAQFHPLRFAFTLARNLPIYEHTKVTELLPGKAATNRGIVTYQKAIVATHFPVLNKHGAYFLKLYQHRSYVVAVEGAADVNGMYVDADEKGLSLRNYGKLLLVGGGAHRTGKPGGNWREPEAFVQRRYPTARIVNRWATQDCMTLDGVPYIGPYSKSTPDLYVATGFNKWGISSSMAAAKLLTDRICGRENAADAVFAPSRRMLRPQLAVNAFESIAGLLTPTVPRCPHLGCALKYNPDEHSWDCSCHGSRFSEQGELIDNPATDDKRGLGR